jgi:hypothetical protein
MKCFAQAMTPASWMPLIVSAIATPAIYVIFLFLVNVLYCGVWLNRSCKCQLLSKLTI